MKIAFVRPEQIQQGDRKPEIEQLETAVAVALRGVLTITIEAPADDQLLYDLVPKTDAPEQLINKAWVRNTITVLEPTINQMLADKLSQLKLFPMSPLVQPFFIEDERKRLVYVFQIDVQNVPPAAMPVASPLLPGGFDAPPMIQ